MRTSQADATFVIISPDEGKHTMLYDAQQGAPRSPQCVQASAPGVCLYDPSGGLPARAHSTPTVVPRGATHTSAA